MPFGLENYQDVIFLTDLSKKPADHILAISSGQTIESDKIGPHKEGLFRDSENIEAGSNDFLADERFNESLKLRSIPKDTSLFRQPQRRRKSTIDLKIHIIVLVIG